MLVLFECAAGYAVFKVLYIGMRNDMTQINGSCVSYRHVGLKGMRPLRSLVTSVLRPICTSNSVVGLFGPRSLRS